MNCLEATWHGSVYRIMYSQNETAIGALIKMDNHLWRVLECRYSDDHDAWRLDMICIVQAD